MVFYLYIYSHASVTVVKKFIKQDQQIKRTLDNSLQEQKHLFESFFFLYCIKEWNNLSGESFWKWNQHFNLKRKFSVSSDQKKTPFLRLMK